MYYYDNTLLLLLLLLLLFTVADGFVVLKELWYNMSHPYPPQHKVMEINYYYYYYYFIFIILFDSQRQCTSVSQLLLIFYCK